MQQFTNTLNDLDLTDDEVLESVKTVATKVGAEIGQVVLYCERAAQTLSDSTGADVGSTHVFQIVQDLILNNPKDAITNPEETSH